MMPNTTQQTAEAASAVVNSGLLKYFGLHLFFGMAAAALGFLFLWPKTPREGFARLLTTLITSSVLGPFLVTLIHMKFPALFASARATAELNQLDGAIGVLFVSSPLFVIAGLPAWWILGGVVRWLEKRREHDLIEMASDLIDLSRHLKNRK